MNNQHHKCVHADTASERTSKQKSTVNVHELCEHVIECYHNFITFYWFVECCHFDIAFACAHPNRLLFLAINNHITSVTVSRRLKNNNHYGIESYRCFTVHNAHNGLFM